MLKKFLARISAWIGGGWGAISLAGFARTIWPTIWRRLQDLETLHTLWTFVGGDVPLIISIAASPFFGALLILIGLVGIPAANRKIAGERIHIIWPVLGWVFLF
jgi:hypothetical protein